MCGTVLSHVGLPCLGSEGLSRVISRRNRLCMLLLALIVGALEVYPVAAVWGGSFYPTYEYSGTFKSSVKLPSPSVSASAGTCRVEVDQRMWLDGYPTGAYSYAWIGSDTEMGETITATWYISATWTLDYRLATAEDCWDPDNEIKLEVIYLVYNSLGEQLQQRVAWAAILTAEGTTWVNEEAVIDRVIEKSFWVDLESGKAYTFRVMLKVTIVDGGWLYQCTARSDHNNPACLTVDRIDYYVS